MNMNEAFPSEYLKSVDLKGQTMTLNMDRVELKSFSNGEQGYVLYFQGAKKGLSLNKTKTSTIMDAYGPDSAMWTGKPVSLSPGKASFQGRQFDVVNIDIPTGPAQAAPPAQAYTPPSQVPPDANPFQKQQNQGCNDPVEDLPF